MNLKNEHAIFLTRSQNNLKKLLHISVKEDVKPSLVKRFEELYFNRPQLENSTDNTATRRFITDSTSSLFIFLIKEKQQRAKLKSELLKELEQSKIQTYSQFEFSKIITETEETKEYSKRTERIIEQKEQLIYSVLHGLEIRIPVVFGTFYLTELNLFLCLITNYIRFL